MGVPSVSSNKQQNCESFPPPPLSQTSNPMAFCDLEDFAESCLKKAKVSSSSSSTSSYDLQYYLDVPPIEFDNNNQFCLFGW